MSKQRLYPTAAGGATTAVPERLSKIRDAAIRHGLDEHYVRRLVETRRVASVKLGKYRLVDLDSLEDLIAAGYTPAEPQGMRS